MKPFHNRRETRNASDRTFLTAIVLCYGRINVGDKIENQSCAANV